MLSIIRTDKKPIDPGTYTQIPIVYIGPNVSLLAGRILKLETVYQVVVPENERYELIGAGERKGQGKDIQYIETVYGPPSVLTEGPHEPVYVHIKCARQTGAGVRIKSGDIIAYLISDTPTFKVNTQQAKKAA